MKIALLTVFDEKFQDIAERTAPSMRRYADTFNLEFVVRAPDLRERPAAWSKISHIREVLRSGFDHCFYVDADAMFVRFDEDIRDQLTAAKDLYLCWVGPEACEPYRAEPRHFNTGIMVWRNCAWSLDFLDEVFHQHEFFDHQWWEQAAILKLLGFRSVLGLAGGDPDPNSIPHVQSLDVNWNSLVGLTIGSDPIVRHAAGMPIPLRITALDREIFFQSVREHLPPDERAALSRHLNLIAHQISQLDLRVRNVEDSRAFHLCGYFVDLLRIARRRIGRR